ncbi:MAG: ABC transporter substrate-binding protein [Gammaproteobacteria bacterium]|nr:ABC transporter substrate-binding protein [Gammaproteobacteria bacterium]NIR83116.1 ABC transporter substrate-binding protein [Gammaproteobacteria bacterium]NIR90778.1 ABC transporter substrate-binding protein [Gammaproteobacteria bacterium]NIU04269.1 ABC transporter substrate-binding protein [Gammaproteobacteria bacterium]NIV51561.1 ABC transporter substrate-binding protein [Gammaproteobacteria bacterium]
MRRFLWTLLLAFACAGLAQAQDKVVVGVLAPLTGFAAADGQSALTGIELAARKINEEGGLLGKPIELKVYDDQADPKQAVNFARRLIEQDRASLVIGGSYSGATLAAAPVCNDNAVPMMAAYAVAPNITHGHPYVYRMGLLGTIEGRTGAVLAEQLQAKRIAILSIKNDFGQALEDGFREEAKQRRLDIVFEDTYPLGNKNFTSTLVRIKAANPDVLYASGYYTEAANLVRQAQSVGLQAQIVGQEGYDSPKFIELAGPAANGVMITTTLDRESTEGGVPEFLQAYQAETGVPADMVGASGYAALRVMAQAVNTAGSLDGGAVRKTLAGLSDVETVVGRVYRWTAEGDPVKTATVQVVKDGEFHRYVKITERAVLMP